MRRRLVAGYRDVVPKERRRTVDKFMKYVYILKSTIQSEHYYIGITSDLRERIRKHNTGEVPHTSKFKPDN